jgi:hypothetical protein
MFGQSTCQRVLALAVLACLCIAAVDSAAVPTAQNLVAADDLQPTPLGPWYQGTASFFGGPQVRGPCRNSSAAQKQQDGHLQPPTGSRVCYSMEASLICATLGLCRPQQLTPSK